MPTASSLPWWKTETITIPEHMSIIRDDLFSSVQLRGNDDPYFKTIHNLERITDCCLPVEFTISAASVNEYSDHICECYRDTGITSNELQSYMKHPVYDPDLWIAIREPSNHMIVASGIAEYDQRIGEGILEWIQVSPMYRRNGIGRFVVCELLRRMKTKGASFVTVSGRMQNPEQPLLLYASCGFTEDNYRGQCCQNNMTAVHKREKQCAVHHPGKVEIEFIVYRDACTCYQQESKNRKDCFFIRYESSSSFYGDSAGNSRNDRRKQKCRHKKRIQFLLI